MRFLDIIFVQIFISGMFCQAQDSGGNPCTMASVLDGKEREVSLRLAAPDNPICDGELTEGWYGITLAGVPAQIPTQCLRNNICGTRLPYWLDLGPGGQMPLPGSEVTASYCASYDVLGTVDCCVLKLPARVYNCGEQGYVYYLTPPDRCPVAYCAQESGTVLDPMYITERGRNASELAQVTANETVESTPDSSMTQPADVTTVLIDGNITLTTSIVLDPSTSGTSSVAATKGATGESAVDTTYSGSSPITPTVSIVSGESTENSSESLTPAAENQTEPDPLATDSSGTSGPVTDVGLTFTGEATLTTPSATTIGVYPAPETSGKTIFISDHPYPYTNPQTSDSGEIPTHSTIVKFISNVPTPAPSLETTESTSQMTQTSDSLPQGAVDLTTEELPVPSPTSFPSQPINNETQTDVPVQAETATVPEKTTLPLPTVSTSLPSSTSRPSSPTTDLPTTQTVKSTEEQTSVSPTTKKTVTDPPKIEYILLKLTGRQVTSERIRKAVIDGIKRRCSVGLDTASPPVKQVFVTYRLCESLGRKKRQSKSTEGLNPKVSGAYKDLSGTFHADLALTKSNGTADVAVPAQDLLTILQDEEVKGTFLNELGVESAEICGKGGTCTELTMSNQTASRQADDEETDIFHSYLGLFIAMIVIGSLCLLIIVFALLYIRCRSHRGSWKNDYNSPERSRLNGKGNKTGAIESPLTDAEMMKGEDEMREKEGHQTPVNGHHGNYPDEDNGWVVPFDQLTNDERSLPALSDTKL